MFNWKQKLVAVAIGIFLSMGAVAQKRGEDKRPPKEDNRVVVQPKGEKPPPQNNNNQGNKGRGDKKGKP